MILIVFDDLAEFRRRSTPSGTRHERSRAADNDHAEQDAEERDDDAVVRQWEEELATTKQDAQATIE